MPFYHLTIFNRDQYSEVGMYWNSVWYSESFNAHGCPGLAYGAAHHSSLQQVYTSVIECYSIELLEYFTVFLYIIIQLFDTALLPKFKKCACAVLKDVFKINTYIDPQSLSLSLYFQNHRWSTLSILVTKAFQNHEKQTLTTILVT